MIVDNWFNTKLYINNLLKTKFRLNVLRHFKN